MKKILHAFSLIFMIFNCFAMEVSSTPPLKPGVYLTEIDNQTDEHMRISVCGIEPEFRDGQLTGFCLKMDNDRNPLITALKTVCPGKKITEIIPIAMTNPLLNKNREMTCAANLRIDRIDHPEKNPEYFWLYRTNEYDGLLCYIKSRDTSARGYAEKVVDEKSVASDKPDSLFTLVKVIIEKPHLRCMKMIAQTVSQISEAPKEEAPKKAPRRIIIRRKQQPPQP